MTKHILVVHYSQSGQLTEIASNFCVPFTEAGSEQYEIESVSYTPAKAYPFPWTGAVFFDTMPETVLEVPEELILPAFKRASYDLIVLAYQPWFLSPSRPFSSLLKHPEMISRMKDTPIVTLIGSRNMWLNSQESVKKLISAANGKLIGNIPLIDRHNNLASAVSILHWMLTGQKTKKWGIFPKPGVSDKDITGVVEYGRLLEQHLRENRIENYQQAVVSHQGVNISVSILFIESRAKKLFLIWANLIMKKIDNGGNRKFWVNFFKYYLVVALFIVSPVVLTIYHIFVRPFTGKNIKRQLAYYSGVELKKQQ